PLMTAGGNNTTVTISSVQTGSRTATGTGTFQLSFNGQTTTPLRIGATTAQVQTALNALPSIGDVGGSVAVSLANGIYTVTFGGNLLGLDLPPITATADFGYDVLVNT